MTAPNQRVQKGDRVWYDGAEYTVTTSPDDQGFIRLSPDPDRQAPQSGKIHVNELG